MNDYFYSLEMIIQRWCDGAQGNAAFEVRAMCNKIARDDNL